MGDNNNSERFRLGQWTVDPDRLLCKSSSQTVQLQPKHMAVLQELANNAPAVVTRSTLIDRVWPRGFVNPNVLNNAISRLRKELDSDANSLFETIPRHGYRLTVSPDREPGHKPLAWQQGSPYRGLDSYGSEHAGVFFGRSREIADILGALAHQAENGQGFVLLLGASGVGKTSLIDAGVVPALLTAESGLLNARWCVARFKSGSNHSCWHSLSSALCAAFDEAGVDNLDAVTLAESLQLDLESSLEELIDRLDQMSAERTARVCLVLDHLELLLSSRATATENETFFAALHEMVRTGRIWVIAGLRSDFYQECARSPALTALRRDHGQYDVSTPDTEQMGRIIREPAAAAGLVFDKDPDTGVGLDDLLQARSMGIADGLPLLQFTLDELYNHRVADNRLTYLALSEMGGLAESMARRAEEIFASLEGDAQQELPVVLSAMVRLAGGDGRRHSRRFAVIPDLITTPSREKLVDAFVQGRLFVTDLLNEQSVVSVAHESLFRHWHRAREILEENHELLAFSHRLSDASSAWEEHSRSDHYLLGAGPLNESERLLSSGALELPVREVELIDASRKRASRSTTARRIAVAALGVLAAVAVTAAGIATIERREAIVEAERASQTTDFLVKLFELANPGQAGGNDLTARQVLDLGTQQLAHQLDRQPGVRSSLLHTIGSVYMNLGLYEDAGPLLEDALDIRRSDSVGASEIAESLNGVGKLNYFRSNYQVASQYYAEAIESLSIAGLEDSAGFAKTLNNQGEVAAALGDYTLAIETHRTALELRQRLFGPQTAETGTSLQNLAGALRRNGESEEAERMYRESISIQEIAYGPDHPEVAVALSNLGLLLTDTERFDQAEPLLVRALDIRRAVFGDNHLHTANSLHNLSALLFRQNDYRRAEPLLLESLALHHELFGDHHDSVAYGRNNLATLLLETGRVEESLEQFSKAHESLTITLGAEHPNTAVILGNLAKAALASGDYPLAKDSAAAAVKVLSSALPPDHWRLAAVKGNYGAALLRLGDSGEAEKMLLESWQVLSASHGTESALSQRVLEFLLDLYREVGDIGKLEKYEALKR